MTDFTVTPAVLTEHILEREGCRVHYWLGGPEDRPLVVFMHGATMDHRMFNAQVAPLIPEYRVLVWDARGHGKSQPMGNGFSLEICAADMLAILDEAGIEQAVVGGQSLGGYMAQQLYSMAPERVRAMIIIGATPLSKAYGKLDIWMLKASLPLFRWWPYGHFTKTVSRATARTKPVQNYALAAAQQIKHADFLKVWKAVTTAVDSEGKPNLILQVPLLLLHGEHDGTGTIKRDMPRWAEKEPDAAYYVIPEAGHNANQDNPAFTNARLLDFLRHHAG